MRHDAVGKPEQDSPDSDIDLTLKGDKLALDDLLLFYRFDLSLYDQIDNPELIEHIERVEVVFYER